MFPYLIRQQWDYSEDEIRRAIDDMYEAIDRENDIIYEACGADGLPVGLIGWTTSSLSFPNGMMNGEKSIPDGLVIRPEKYNSTCFTFSCIITAGLPTLWICTHGLESQKGSEQRDRELSKTDRAMEYVLSQ